LLGAVARGAVRVKIRPKRFRIITRRQDEVRPFVRVAEPLEAAAAQCAVLEPPDRANLENVGGIDALNDAHRTHRRDRPVKVAAELLAVGTGHAVGPAAEPWARPSAVKPDRLGQLEMVGHCLPGAGEGVTDSAIEIALLDGFAIG